MSEILRELDQHLVERGWEEIRTAWIFALGRTDQGPTTINDLAGHLDVSKQAASKTIEQMEQNRLVRLVPFPGDGRKRVIELTDEGQRLRDDILDSLAQIECSWTTRIGDHGVQMIREHLTTVLIDERHNSQPPAVSTT